MITIHMLTTALAPITHMSGTSGNAALLKRETILGENCCLERIPCISGNAIRHALVRVPANEVFKGEFKRFLPEFKEKYGIHVTGIRRDESSVRDMRFLLHGYESKWSFAPLSNLKCQDIFTYIHVNDLPLHASYRMVGDGDFDRYRVRVAAIGNPRGRGVGRLVWEKRYYGDIINKNEHKQS